MRKKFSFSMIGGLALLATVGCAREEKPDDYGASMLENLPFVYKMTVQQGNILTEEMVHGLKPGMTKHQVSLVLGTPLLTDFFHANRWDYVYTIQRGHQPMKTHSLTLHFQDDVLVRVDGTPPSDGKGASPESKEIVVSVPDYEKHKGLLERSLDSIRLNQEK